MKSRIVKRININLTKEDLENIETAKIALNGENPKRKATTSDTIREVLGIFAMIFENHLIITEIPKEKIIIDDDDDLPF